MKQRITEAGKDAEKNIKKETKKETKKEKSPGVRYSWKYFLMELGVMFLGTAEMYLLCLFRGEAWDRLLGNCCMALLGLAVTGFQIRREYLHDNLDYNNREHVPRFWFCVIVGLLAAGVCGLLPVGGWPFLAVFLMLALFSNLSTGITASAMLLVMAVLISGGTVGSFALYMVSGVFTAALFQHMNSEFKIGIPLFLSVLCLLVCETANIILVANARPDLEMFVVPVANMIVSGILLLGCLKLFFSVVIYQYREKYMELNDTGNPVLVDMKQHNRAEYYHSIHTAYFCERIAVRLGLDADALKCAGYYYRMGDGLDEFMNQKNFPPAVKNILMEYRTCRKRPVQKETAVLICAETVLKEMGTPAMREEELTEKRSRDRSVDRRIDSIFRKFAEDENFIRCDITVQELCTVQRIFKEEKLYYDFLR